MLQTIWEGAAIEVIIFVICLYYGIKMMLTKSADAIWKNNKPKFTDEAEYAKRAGILIIFLGVFSILAAVMRMYLDPYAGIGTVIVVIMIFGFFWKRMSDKYIIKK